MTRISARADLKAGSHHIALTAAEAFGAHWAGTFDWRDANTGWQFALAADHLSTRSWTVAESTLARKFFRPGAAVPEFRVARERRSGKFARQGQIGVDQFTLAPLVVRHLEGDLKIGGRHLQVAGAKAQFFGGNLDGSFDAQLTAMPSYRIHLDYSHVDLASLTSVFPHSITPSPALLPAA